MTDPLHPAQDGPQMPEPVAWRTFDGEGGYDYRTYEGNEDYATEWARRNPRHVGWVEPLITTASAHAFADALAAHRVALAVAAERERCGVYAQKKAVEYPEDSNSQCALDTFGRLLRAGLVPWNQPPATGK